MPTCRCQQGALNFGPVLTPLTQKFWPAPLGGGSRLPDGVESAPLGVEPGIFGVEPAPHGEPKPARLHPKMPGST